MQEFVIQGRENRSVTAVIQAEDYATAVKMFRETNPSANIETINDREVLGLSEATLTPIFEGDRFVIDAGGHWFLKEEVLEDILGQIHDYISELIRDKNFKKIDDLLEEKCDNFSALTVDEILEYAAATLLIKDSLENREKFLTEAKNEVTRRREIIPDIFVGL